MALKVNLRHLEDNNLHLQGEMTAEELDLDPRDDVIHPTHPLSYDIEVQLLEEALFVEGRLSMPLSCDCVRCLKQFEHLVTIDPWTVHIPLKGEEAAPIINDLVDLTPYVREDILLDFPQHPLCGSECGGLPVKAKQAGTPEKNSAEESSAWGVLNKLKL